MKRKKNRGYRRRERRTKGKKKRRKRGREGKKVIIVYKRYSILDPLYKYL